MVSASIVRNVVVMFYLPHTKLIVCICLCSLAGGGVMDGASNVRVSKSVLDSAREELKGRTGLTDSEDEGGSGGEGSSN